MKLSAILYMKIVSGYSGVSIQIPSKLVGRNNINSVAYLKC